MSKNQVTLPFNEEEIKKMNFLICDRLNGSVLNEEAPVSQALTYYEEEEGEYGYMKKWKVEFSRYKEYVLTLSMNDVKNIYKEFWHDEIPVKKDFKL